MTLQEARDKVVQLRQDLWDGGILMTIESMEGDASVVLYSGGGVIIIDLDHLGPGQ